MIKKFLGFVVLLFAVCDARAAQVVNVEYVHNLISRYHNVDVLYNVNLGSPFMAVNMKYLLTAVDVANEKLNGYKTTDYANSEYATGQVVDTVAANQAVKTLIKKVIEDETAGDFWVVPAGTSTSFSFKISAAGNYVIDWGDGSVVDVINKTDTNSTTYSHTYSNAASNYTVYVSGKATAYSTSDEVAAVSFAGTLSNSWFGSGTPTSKIKSFDGCLGCVFGTLADGTQPRFFETFANNPDIKSLPAGLFSGIYGNATTKMFRRTFQYCYGLTELPAGLFAGLRGQPADSMFSSTFNRCTGLKSLPEGIFDSFSGVPVYEMFNNTFSNCTSLASIPNGLFKHINGAPAEKMFNYTFEKCTKLTSIPSDLFGKIEGDAATNMFSYMFSGCTGLTGDSAKINGEFLYNIWESGGTDMYANCSKLSDYSTMPSAWK